MALQAAWSAIHATRHAKDHLIAGLRQAVAIGDDTDTDTDTVAAIAGNLLGARYGADDLVRLAGAAVGYDAAAFD